ESARPGHTPGDTHSHRARRSPDRLVQPGRTGAGACLQQRARPGEQVAATSCRGVMQVSTLFLFHASNVTDRRQKLLPTLATAPSPPGNKSAHLPHSVVTFTPARAAGARSRAALPPADCAG